MYATKPCGFCGEASPTPSPYTRYRHVPSFCHTPSQDAAKKSCGPDNNIHGWKAILQGLQDPRPRTWLGVCLSEGPRRTLLRRWRSEVDVLSPPRARRARPFHHVASRRRGAPSALPADCCVCTFAPRIFCVNEDPRFITVSTSARARTIAGGPLSIDPRQPSCVRTQLSPFYPARRPLHARRRSSAAPLPIPLPRISCAAHRLSSTPSTSTALAPSKRHAPRLAAPLAARRRNLQHDGGARDPCGTRRRA
ncbi:hypothetical protein B0H10DRAFT_1277958 [Mycena sp. CBHHK59/15]|nr:hypothetical protein B0H10DRAFT_1277958 [Mycena sp. CBHHK59/15]